MFTEGPININQLSLIHRLDNEIFNATRNLQVVLYEEPIVQWMWH